MTYSLIVSYFLSNKRIGTWPIARITNVPMSNPSNKYYDHAFRCSLWEGPKVTTSSLKWLEEASILCPLRPTEKKEGGCLRKWSSERVFQFSSLTPHSFFFPPMRCKELSTFLYCCDCSSYFYVHNTHHTCHRINKFNSKFGVFFRRNRLG